LLDRAPEAFPALSREQPCGAMSVTGHVWRLSRRPRKLPSHPSGTGEAHTLEAEGARTARAQLRLGLRLPRARAPSASPAPAPATRGVLAPAQPARPAAKAPRRCCVYLTLPYPCAAAGGRAAGPAARAGAHGARRPGAPEPQGVAAGRGDGAAARPGGHRAGPGRARLRGQRHARRRVCALPWRPHRPRGCGPAAAGPRATRATTLRAPQRLTL